MEWNAAGGGFGDDGRQGLHWRDFRDRPIYLLSDADRDMVLEVWKGLGR